MKVDADLEKVIDSRQSGDDFYNDYYLSYQIGLWKKYYEHFEKKLTKVKKQDKKDQCNEQMEYSKKVIEKYEYVILHI